MACLRAPNGANCCLPVVLAMSLVIGVSACGRPTSTALARTPAANAAVLLAKFACPAAPLVAGANSTDRSASDHLQIVTTVAPITSIVANIAGDRADVHGVIPEGTNSHTFEPRPNVAKLMSTADIVFVNGLKLEDPTRDIAETNMPDGAEMVELGNLTINPGQYIYDFSFPEDGGKPNPHLWTDPPMAECYAAIAASAMQRADPANAAYYAANYARYSARVDALDTLMQRATSTVPPDDRKLLTYHDAYAYFAVRYGYQVIGAIQVSDFEEPTPKEVANLIEQIKATHVPAIFGSEVFPSSVLAQIAAESGTSYVDVLRDDDLPGAPGESDHSYLGLMKFDFVTLVSNLGGDPSMLEAFDASDVVFDEADYPQ
jgi:ABC-type Zn uptake system ZnuABC Zn-binding protein ZnuA